jgi:hypothetical protein
MIKKISVIALLLVIFALIPIGFAEDTNTIIDANTEQEIKLMLNPFGAEVRLIQLEKSVTRNILVGAKIIEIIQKNHVDENIDSAQNVLNQMEALLNDIKNIDLEEDKNILVAEFVAMKKEATDLSKQFREITTTILTANDRQEISEAIKDIDKVQLKGVNNEVKNAIRTHNAERIEALLGQMGVNNPELIQKIIDGNTIAAEVKQGVMNAFNALSTEQKQMIETKIKEGSIKRKISEREFVAKAKENGLQKMLQRDQNKFQRMNEWTKSNCLDINSNGFEERANRLKNLGETNQISEKIGNWKSNKGN